MSTTERTGDRPVGISGGKEVKGFLVGESCWVTVGEILKSNSDIRSLHFCLFDSDWYTKPLPGKLFHNKPAAILTIGRDYLLEGIMQTPNGGDIITRDIKQMATEGKGQIEPGEPIQATEDKYLLSLMSNVELNDGSSKHIPMLDFSGSGLGKDVDGAREALIELGQKKGFILDSGKGMHYYGAELLTEAEWRDFMHYSFLLNFGRKVVDPFFLAHRLIDGFACLRVSNNSVKKTTPTILEVFPGNKTIKETEVNDLIRTGELDSNLISDGYHTFRDLYEHRHALFITLCNVLNEQDGLGDQFRPWKSKKHFDGTMYDGMFIAGVANADGLQITYHLPLGAWDVLKVTERPNAPEWDGSTPKDVLGRLYRLK
jgi:hypothetical protein